MSEKSENSFEILHLISVLSLRFSNIFIKCDLDVEQIYTLIYLDHYGLLYAGENNENEKIIQREHIAKILEEVFNCDRNRRSNLLKRLYHDGFIKDFFIKPDEKQALFGEGRTRVISLTTEGNNKIEEFITELKILFNEIIDSKHNLLLLPQSTRKGTIAKSVMLFLKFFRKK